MRGAEGHCKITTHYLQPIPTREDTPARGDGPPNSSRPIQAWSVAGADSRVGMQVMIPGALEAVAGPGSRWR